MIDYNHIEYKRYRFLNDFISINKNEYKNLFSIMNHNKYLFERSDMIKKSEIINEIKKIQIINNRYLNAEYNILIKEVKKTYKFIENLNNSGTSNKFLENRSFLFSEYFNFLLENRYQKKELFKEIKKFYVERKKETINEVLGFLKGIWNTIKSAGSGFINFIKGLFGLSEKEQKTVVKNISKFPDAEKKIIDTQIELIRKFRDNYSKKIDVTKDESKILFLEFSSATPTIIELIVEYFEKNKKENDTKFLNKLKEELNNLKTELLEADKKIIDENKIYSYVQLIELKNSQLKNLNKKDSEYENEKKKLEEDLEALDKYQKIFLKQTKEIVDNFMKDFLDKLNELKKENENNIAQKQKDNSSKQDSENISESILTQLATSASDMYDSIKVSSDIYNTASTIGGGINQSLTNFSTGLFGDPQAELAAAAIKTKTAAMIAKMNAVPPPPPGLLETAYTSITTSIWSFLTSSYFIYGALFLGAIFLGKAIYNWFKNRSTMNRIGLSPNILYLTGDKEKLQQEYEKMQKSTTEKLEQQYDESEKNREKQRKELEQKRKDQDQEMRARLSGESETGASSTSRGRSSGNTKNSRSRSSSRSSSTSSVPDPSLATLAPGASLATGSSVPDSSLATPAPGAKRSRK